MRVIPVRIVTQGYVLQRFVSACAGRGAYPIKFNGSIFTMDWIKREKVKGVENTLDARIDGLESIVREVRSMMWGLVSTGIVALFAWLLRGCA